MTQQATVASAEKVDRRSKFYINGQWVDPAGTGTIDVINPATEEVIGVIPEGNAEDVDRAVAAAKAAFESWSQTPVEERIKFIQAITAQLSARQEELATTMSTEMGMPLMMSKMVQAGAPIMTFTSMPMMVESTKFEEQIGNSLVVKEPVGVVGCITPWNYPLHQIAAKVAPALAAGCTVVVKPSEVAPLNAFILAEAIDAAGLPAGVFNLVTGYGPVVGEAIAAPPGRRHGLVHRLDPRRQARQRAGRADGEARRRWSSAASPRTSSSTTPTSRRPSPTVSRSATRTPARPAAR